MKRLLPAVLLAGAACTATAQVPPDITLEQVLPSGTLSGTLGLKHAGDGSDRLFIVRQNGEVRIIDADGQLLSQPFLSLGSLTSGGGERGLLDIAFHPEFAVNGRFFLHYSAGNQRPPGTEFGDTIVAEFAVTADPNLANSTPERIILTAVQDFSNHNGGQTRFGPDGYLWIGLGDGGSGNDPCNRSQTLDPGDIQTGGSCRDHPSAALLGKMLRIDVDQTTPAGSNNLCAAGADGAAEYAVPPDNPYVGQANRCGEVWALGLRNPWRWSFDRADGDLWIGDVGQNTWEEVNLDAWPLAGGLNYGWRICEGSFVRGSTTQPCNLPGSVLPVIEYPTGPAGNCAITGGYRYRGPVNDLQGLYIYGDFCSGRIWFAGEDGGEWISSVFSVEGFDLRSFGEDEQGHVYVLRSGGLWRFDGPMTDLIFADGFESE